MKVGSTEKRNRDDGGSFISLLTLFLLKSQKNITGFESVCKVA